MLFLILDNKTKMKLLNYLPFLFVLSPLMAQHTINISAGVYDRQETPISFVAPSFYNSVINMENKDTLALHFIKEVGDNPFLAHFVFILDYPLEKGQERNYQLHTTQISTQKTIAVAEVNIYNALQYNIITKIPPQSSPNYYKKSGFFHPVKSPQGVILTDDFPEGHRHQHGIFNAWVNTTFQNKSVDFWNQQHLTGTAKSKGENIILKTTAEQYASFEDELFHCTVNRKGVEQINVLHEMLSFNFYATSSHYIFDLKSTHKNITLDTLFINRYHYGGMAFRGSAFWNKEDTMHYQQPMQVLTSEGKNAAESNHTRPNWVCAFGEINGREAGIIIFGHPNNFRFPQPIRVHPTMPYFCFSPMVEDAFYIAPEEQYHAAYRFVTFDGKPNITAIERMWLDYAYPLKVQLGKL